MKVSQLNNVRVRFAPSPTGELHLGSARTALFNFLFAKNNQGKFLLRIEDTDTERSRKVHIDQAINSIKWLGLIPDEEIVFQSHRSKVYKKYLNLLLSSGKAYRCFASKQELQLIREKTNSFQYNGLWRDRSDEEIDEQLELGSPFTIRLKTPNEGSITFDDLIFGEIRVSNNEIDDFIIIRSDGSPVYNFTNVIDDYDMNISHVIRGEDHISNTPKQLHIYQALSFNSPSFAHLPMILGGDKKKLSKRHGAESVESYKDKGFQSAPLINYLALLGWNPGTNEEIMDLSQLISKYDMQKVQKKSAVFDSKKFSWVSSQYLLKQDPITILQLIRKLEPTWGRKKPEEFCMRVIDLMVPRCNFIGDIIQHSFYFFDHPKSYNVVDQKKVWKDETSIILKEIIQLYEKLEGLDHQDLEDLFKGYINSSGNGFGQVMKPMRLAICGSLTGPSLFELMELIGVKDSIMRINIYISEFKNG